MIPEYLIEQWKLHAPWQTLEMVEQDLIISRALVNLYSNQKIKEGLAFRGGTALNKIFIKPPARYSEDIDLVQLNSEPIGALLKAIRECLDPWLGQPQSKITQRGQKLFYRYQTFNGLRGKLKVEINTTEHFHIRPLRSIEHVVNSPWFEGSCELLTYEIDELMATKLSALYQRNKGRDLFDLWLAQKKGLLNNENTINIFNEYCKKTGSQISRANFEQNLAEKFSRPDFRNDIVPLLRPEMEWDFEEGFQMLNENFVQHLSGLPWKGII